MQLALSLPAPSTAKERANRHAHVGVLRLVVGAAREHVVLSNDMGR